MSNARNPADVIDQMVEALGGYESRPIACNDLQEVKRNHGFRAPELFYMTWEEIQEVLVDTIIGSSQPNQLDEKQKAAIRIFTDTPNVV